MPANQQETVKHYRQEAAKRFLSTDKHIKAPCEYANKLTTYAESGRGRANSLPKHLDKSLVLE